MELFCENSYWLPKISIVDVRLGSKYTCGFLATKLFRCISDTNLSSNCKKEKRFSCYIDILGMTDRKQKQAVLLQLISGKVQKIFETLLDA